MKPLKVAIDLPQAGKDFRCAEILCLPFEGIRAAKTAGYRAAPICGDMTLDITTPPWKIIRS